MDARGQYLNELASMDTIVRIFLESGRSAVELALYTVLPIMVVLTVLMRLLKILKVLPAIEKFLARPLRIIGLPGPAFFAALQLLFVSFAAPLETLKRLELGNTPSRQLASTLAIVLSMAQGNATFPLIVDGLSLWIIPISILGGVVASASTYYLFARSREGVMTTQEFFDSGEQKKDAVTELFDAGNEGVKISFQAIPFLLLGIGMMNVLGELGAMSILQESLAGLLERVALPDVASIPIVTKYLAGGTAMMGVAHNLILEGALSACELNRMAGLTMNPCDFVGVPLLMTAGRRVRSVLIPALMGAGVGILFRGLFHLILF